MLKYVIIIYFFTAYINAYVHPPRKPAERPLKPETGRPKSEQLINHPPQIINYPSPARSVDPPPDTRRYVDPVRQPVQLVLPEK